MNVAQQRRTAFLLSAFRLARAGGALTSGELMSAVRNEVRAGDRVRARALKRARGATKAARRAGRGS